MNQDLSRTWMTDCLSSHENCRLEESSPLPTRVIDVQAGCANQRCRIVETRGRTGRYVALSHCWGGAITPVLSDETIRDFFEDLPVSQLPANFQDAVKITRDLGFQYLWVDSLCIRQDSKIDWQIESANMAAVYQNAAITLYAAASPGSKHGIFPRDSEATLSCQRLPPCVSLSVAQAEENQQEVRVQLLEEDDDEDLWKLDVSSPLSIRGWCLQELVLSPRRLICGRKQFYWQCLRGYHAADGLPRCPGLRTPTLEFRDITKQVNSVQSVSKEEVLFEYYQLVAKYSQRKLTFGSDKLPAFSGLAQKLHPVIGGEYIAGLWTADITSGLLWRSRDSSATHSRDYRAPSWSWAVTDEPLGFSIQFSIGQGLRPPGQWSAELVSHSVKPANPYNPYGEVDSAQITIKAWCKRFICSSQRVTAVHDIQHPEVGTVRFDEDVRVDSRLPPSCPALLVTTACGEDNYLVSVLRGTDKGGSLTKSLEPGDFSSSEHIAVIIDSYEYFMGDKSLKQSQLILSCLVLRAVSGSDSTSSTWERVGYLEIRETTQLHKSNWMSTWHQQNITMI